MSAEIGSRTTAARRTTSRPLHPYGTATFTGLLENSKPDVWKGLKPKDVAAMLAMLKIARIASGNAKEDNWVDLAGYAACGGEIETGYMEKI